MLLYRSLQGRIMAALAFVTLFSIIGLGMVAYWSERDVLQTQLSLELTSSVDYTKQRLQDWLHERQSDVRFLAMNSANQASFLQLLTEEVTPEAKDSHRLLLHASLLSIQQARPEYRRILMADDKGTILVAANPALIGRSVANQAAFTETLRLPPTALAQGYIEDIHYDEALDTYIMCFGYPLLAPASSSEDKPMTLGVVLITVDVEKTVYPILSEWRMGQSGAAILSRAEGEETRLLNPVRGTNAPPLFPVLPAPTDPQHARPAYWAARGAEGTRQTLDHLGVEVFTVYRHIPEMKWGLVLKMDTAEIFAPSHELVRHVIYIALGVLAVALMVSIWIARTLTKPLNGLFKTAQAVAAGAPPVYTALERHDEIGDLARSFRDMIDALQRQQQQLKAANEVAGSILGLRPLDEILEEVVQAARWLTDAHSAEFTFHEPVEQHIALPLKAPVEQKADRLAFEPFNAAIGPSRHNSRIHSEQNGHDFIHPASPPLDQKCNDLTGIRINEDFTVAEQASLTLPVRSRNCDYGVLQVKKANERSFTQADNDILQALTTYAAVALENARLMHRLQNLNAELEQKVEERTHKLAEANQQLLVLDKMKSELLYSISHELRHPIANLKFQLDLLHHHIDSPRREKYLTALVNQVDVLVRLVVDMLDFIRIEEMHSQIVFTKLDINTIVMDVIKPSLMLIQQPNQAITLDFVPHPTPLFVSGDPKHLSLAVTHLLRNAINFTPKGEIKVRLWRKEAAACLQIQDTGIGIAENDLPHIFDRFFRGENVSQSTIPGSGLGLSIVEKIIALHGGHLDVTSNLGQGSTFCLQLPLCETI